MRRSPLLPTEIDLDQALAETELDARELRSLETAVERAERVLFIPRLEKATGLSPRNTHAH